MKVAFFDIDGTLIADASGVSFMLFVQEKGKFRKEIGKQLLKTKEDYFSGKISYEQFAENWEEAYGEGLRGEKQKEMYNLTQEFWEIIQPKVAYWAKDLITLLKNNGFKTIAISGSNAEPLG
jgi:phosphoserine phosphatase